MQSMQHFHVRPVKDNLACEINSQQAEDRSTGHVDGHTMEKLYNGSHEERRHHLREQIGTVQYGYVQTHAPRWLGGRGGCVHGQGHVQIK